MFITRRTRVRRRVACTLLMASAFSGPGLDAAHAASGAPAEVVIATRAITPGGAFPAIEDPAAALWARVPEASVELNLAPPVHPSIALSQEAAKGAGSSPLALNVSAVTDAQRIYIRLRWKDRTRDDQRRTAVFPDAAAVETPNSQAETSPVMGAPDTPVSIWRWDAAKNEVEALIAGSPGTLTRTASESLHGKGVYRSVRDPARNEWLVVISQALDEAAEDRISLRARKQFPAAFAVWQGSDRQRGGFKRVSGWVSVHLPE